MNLYVAHVGFYDEKIGIYELHTNIHVVAPNIKTARDVIKNNPVYIEKGMHIDGIEELLSVDGYKIEAIKSDSFAPNKTYSHEDLKALG